MNTKKKITMDDLFPTAEQARNIAYYGLSGDPVGHHTGIHKGHADFKDTAGRRKRDVYMAAGSGKLGYFSHILRETRKGRRISRSNRRYVLKASGGMRPLDIPSEDKRILATFARFVLEEKIESLLHDGQTGGRRMK